MLFTSIIGFNVMADCCNYSTPVFSPEMLKNRESSKDILQLVISMVKCSVYIFLRL